MHFTLRRLITLLRDKCALSVSRASCFGTEYKRSLHLSALRICHSGAFFVDDHVDISIEKVSQHVPDVPFNLKTQHLPDEGGNVGKQLEEECEKAAFAILQETVPLKIPENIMEFLKEAKNSKEVRHILETILYQNSLCWDLLNGHGYRVAVLQALTAVAPHTLCLHEWFECVGKFRRLGFLLTRTFVAEGLTLIRQWLLYHFNHEGRSPLLVTEGLSHIHDLVQFSKEDRLVFDHVLYTRIVYLLTMIVSFFDRQNIYRSNFPESFEKRDGVVVEWVIGNERCVDYDECVMQCDQVMEEMLEMLRLDISSRPNFSLMYRLIDYYFATDNVEKMIAVMEDAESYNIDVAESSTAKLMQLACAFNYPNVPELFMRWRVLLPQCVIAAPDVSRLLSYFSRAGGGRPCPYCGEPYNHRNVNVYVWQKTPAHQRECSALMDARQRKGVVDEKRTLPQNQDWSEVAFGLWHFSQTRAIEWGIIEWRSFLLCCIFSPRALEAKQLVDTFFDHKKMDHFLRATYMRLVRHHAPDLVLVILRQWCNKGPRLSPIVLQESLMCAVMIKGEKERLEAMKEIWKFLLEKDSYIMPFTKRLLQKRLNDLRVRPSGVTLEEETLFAEMIRMQPRQLSLLDVKDSTADFVVGISKKNVYISSVKGRIEEVERSQRRRV